MRRFFLLLILCALVPLWLGNPAGACSIPVFRYAMERWPAYYYEAIVIHKGPLADDDPAVNLLKGKQAEFLNLRVSPVDVDNRQGQGDPISQKNGEMGTHDALATTGDLTGLLQGPVPETLPALVLWYPMSKGRAAPFWTGPFTVGTVETIIQSPKRRELVRRLTAGQTAVWIFVESGNAGKDKAAMQLIKRELDKATKELKEMAPAFGEELQTAEPGQNGVEGFSYEFSILPVSRSDRKEQMLLETLLNSEPDLDEYSNEPIVFPTFGRGRALFALVGDGINTDNLREAIAFITGPCGCEIKMLNPGVDLLMNENWDAAAMQFYQEFYETAEEPLPELTGVFPEEPDDAGPNAQGEVVAAAVGESAQPLSAPAGDIAVEVPRRKGHGFGVMGTTAVCVAAILIAVGLGTLAVTKRRKGD